MPMGKCLDCGRTARLGKLVGERHVVNADGSQHKEAIPADERLRCIDCCFGPPMRNWKTCPVCGARTPSVAACEVCRAAELATSEREPSRTRRRTPNLLEGIDLWLQAWCSRGRVLDTHAWCAKMDRLNSLKVASRQVLRTTTDIRLLSEQL